jgi:hypothetical protein
MVGFCSRNEPGGRRPCCGFWNGTAANALLCASGLKAGLGRNGVPLVARARRDCGFLHGLHRSRANVVGWQGAMKPEGRSWAENSAVTLLLCVRPAHHDPER